MNDQQSTVDKGRFAEELACKYLEDKGWRVCHRNYYCPYGEIDIVYEDSEGQLVFCEVKAKWSLAFGMPEAEFDIKKRQKFNETVLHYLGEHSINHDNYRVDLIAMLMDQDTRICRLKHYKAYY
jgi:putative endonuclease